MIESRWKIWMSAMRLRTLPAAVAPVLAASALAWHDGRFVGGAALLCLGFALLIQIGTNFANDYYDFIKGADTAARVGPRRAVAAGLIAPGTMRRAMIGVFVAAFLLGLGLLHWGGPMLLAVGVSSILCGVAYTGGPWPLGYHGLGDMFVFLFFGLVAVLVTYFVQAQSITPEAWMVAVAIGLLAANILVVNNYRDVETDRAAHKRTLVVRFGRGFARGQFLFSVLGAGVVPVLLWTRGFPIIVLLPLLLAPLASTHFRRLRDAQTALQLITLLGDTGKLLALYAVLLSVGMLIRN